MQIAQIIRIIKMLCVDLLTRCSCHRGELSIYITGRRRPGSNSLSIAARQSRSQEAPMDSGVPSQHQALEQSGHQQRGPMSGRSHAAKLRSPRKTVRRTFAVGVMLIGSVVTFMFASSALGATSVGLGKAASFSVLGGSTITNTGLTKMFGDLGLAPGSSVTGAPVVLGAEYIDDALANEAKSALTTAATTAANEASNGSAG